MAGSYAKIDYRVRPAKSIERKMLVESFRALKEFGALEHYRYVGLGSVYFSDFALVHRALGVEKMISIENATDLSVQARFRLNVPYGNVEMKFGTSTAILQRLEWSQRTICWLDYDGALVKSCLDDVEYIARNAQSGSVIIASFNAGNIGGGESDEKPLSALKTAVGADSVPVDVESKHLSGWGVGDVYRRIFCSAIEDALLARASTGRAGARLIYKPLYYFRYADGVKMITVGGVLVDESQLGVFRSCNFEQFDFCRTDEGAYLIEAPHLTYAEMRQMDSERTKHTCRLPLPAADIDKYRRFYRYFPKFVEAEIS
ncbi:O-methyltransferase [Xanthomonas sacchari]|uniref:O-methyltransferase n=1 Tax=Xanthomonas sacchari TaxID=56458 RepID=UPI00352914EC